ncbi:L,D-transpeptidase [Streptomyces jumonjinensis]|uniref:L,D-transpeptidase n=1 Tax=Streptomyces jumonjinensis TaxID=1945 RepID=A0A646KFK9_STRJU|nr:Ig-like domain-containing protein [Streptomyces jumonjinensis]MQT01023.1 L,D-transpeptidase [Streptomyces jumonjinensis]
MNQTPRFSTVVRCTLLLLALGVVVTACGEPKSSDPLSTEPFDAAEQVVFNTPRGGVKVNPDKPFEVTVKGEEGRITDVRVTDDSGHHLGGELAADGSRWRSTGPLSAGAKYTARVATENKKGAPGARMAVFETSPAKRLLSVGFGPEEGTYGVAQPIIAELSLPVADREARAVVERGLKIDSKPAVEGAWHWVDDEVLHFRPKDYWPTGAKVSVSSNLQGVRISNQLYGDKAEKPVKFTIGDRLEAITDASAHYMTVLLNGEVINTIPITTGKPGFSTRNGVKVVLGKEYFVRMRGSSVGIGGSEAYDLPVYYATRVTWSGEYVHAAPWSIGSHGYENVSHGCTGMSTGNAAWFYETFKEGDIVHVINSVGEDMDTFGNGYGDWNLDWDEWRSGSSLVENAPGGPRPDDSARLRPWV